MHEWALAEAVISTLVDILEKERLIEIKEVTIKIGELQQIELDIFNFALSQLKSKKFEKTKFKVILEKAKLECRVCRKHWVFSKEKLDEAKSEAIHFIPEIAHTYIKCPKCKSPDFKVLTGRGVILDHIEGKI